MEAKKLLAAALAMLFAGLAAAEPMAAITVTDLTTGITNQTSPVTAVATAVLGLYLVVKAFKWIRRAMS